MDNEDNNIISLDEYKQEVLDRQKPLLKMGAKLQRLVLEARQHPLGLYKLCFTDDRGEPIILKWFHSEWSDMILKNRFVLIEAARGLTKCRASGQRILLQSGVWEPIENLADKGTVQILSFDAATGKVISSDAWVKDNGYQPTKAITLHDATELDVTHEEPLWTPSGWKKAKDIRVNDYVACLRRDEAPRRRKKKIPPHHAYLIGFIIGDIHVSQFICFRYLRGKNSHTKRVPEILFRARKVDIASFLAGYWDADGSATCVKGPQITFGSVNKALLKDVQVLAKKLQPGCVGLLRESRSKYKGAPYLAYILHFHGRDAIDLRDQIRPYCQSEKAERQFTAWDREFGITLGKVQRWRQAKLIKEGRAPYKINDFGSKSHIQLHTDMLAGTYGIPVQAIKDIIKPINEYFILSHWYDPSGELPKVGLSGQQNVIPPEAVNRLAIILEMQTEPIPIHKQNDRRNIIGFVPIEDIKQKAKQLRRLSDPNIWWNKVKKVEDRKEQQTWSLSSPKYQTFIGEGAVSHNTTFTIAMMLWFIGRNPNIRFKIISGNESNAAKRLSEVKSHIDEDPLYKLIFPHITLDKNRKNDTLNLNVNYTRHTKDATVEARGVFGDPAGDRADVIVGDDIVNLKNALQDTALRPKVIQKVRGDWFNLLNPRDGRVWFIFNPWHEEELNSVLKREVANKGEWVYKRYSHGKPGNQFYSIFPELFPESWLEAKKLSVGSLEYARAYLCKAMSTDVQLVRHEWLRTYNQHDITPDLLNRCTALVSIDPTGSKGTSQKQRSTDPDYIGVTVILIDQDPNSNTSLIPGSNRPTAPFRIYIVDSYQLRLTTAQAAQHVVDLNNRWRPEAILIEAQGAQSLHDWVYERSPQVPTVPVPATISKQARLESITPWMEDPRELILFHPRAIQPNPKTDIVYLHGKQAQDTGDVQNEILRDLRRQLLDFPTTHDDILDSFTMSLRYARQWILPYEDIEEEDMELNTNPHQKEVNIEVKYIG